MNSQINPLRLLVKALVLFFVMNVVFAIVDPSLYKLTVYNSIFPGRVRLPFADSRGIYSVMVNNLDIMVASHEISAPKIENEFRVVIIGDSSVWGDSSPAKETISVFWNENGYSCGNKKLKFYNLAYPHPSVVKDLIILDKALEYNPDMIVWFITLNTLTPRNLSPFIAANADRAVEVVSTYHLQYDVQDVSNNSKLESFYEKTLIGRRSEIARLIKLQILGLIWTISGTDKPFPSHKNLDFSLDVSKETTYKGLNSEAELKEKMMLDALIAGHDMAGSIPVLLVNEPMFIATGINNDVRYNDGYPRWAYDFYRKTMLSLSQQNQWHYLDLWNAIPNEYFYDTVLHISPDGQRLMIPKINPALQSIACQ